MARVRVENFAGLVRDTNSNAIINVNKSDFELYMAQRKQREQRGDELRGCLLYTSPSPRDRSISRMPSSA